MIRHLINMADDTRKRLYVDIGKDIPRITQQIEHDTVQCKADWNAILEQRLVCLVAEHQHSHPRTESTADDGQEEKDEFGDAPFAICGPVLIIAIQEESKHVNGEHADKEDKRKFHNHAALKQEYKESNQTGGKKTCRKETDKNL